MLLSKLVYLCVKNAVYLNDTSFNYKDFVNGNFDNDIDYAMNINNVFTPLNEAIARLSDLDRIPFIVEKVTSVNNNEVDLTQLSSFVKEVKGLAQNNQSLAFKQKYIDTIVILSSVSDLEPIYIEYKEDIKPFNRDDICSIGDDDVDNNIDLRERYGISEAACAYIIEYVQGKLLEPIAPELSNLHITRSETYFSNLQPAKSFTVQTVTRKVYSIGE